MKKIKKYKIYNKYVAYIMTAVVIVGLLTPSVNIYAGEAEDNIYNEYPVDSTAGDFDSTGNLDGTSATDDSSKSDTDSEYTKTEEDILDEYSENTENTENIENTENMEITGDENAVDIDTSDIVMYESSNTAVNNNSEYSATGLPLKYDGRDYNYLTPVRDQKRASMCWAYATIACLEADAVKNNGFTRDLDLSELHLAYFTFNDKKDELGLTDNDYVRFHNPSEENNFVSNGANLGYAVSTLTGNIGPVLESTVDTEQLFRENGELVGNVHNISIDEKYRRGANVLEIENIYIYSMKDRSNWDLIKKGIMEHGAAATSYNSQYTNLYNTTKEYGTAYYQEDKINDPDHGIAIVGWDDNYPVTAFKESKRPSKPGAWLVKNSWGTNNPYATDGYFWLSYEDESFKHVTSENKSPDVYIYDVAPAGSYQDVYQYDGGIIHEYSKTSTEQNAIGYANVFVSQKEENLEAVSIQTDRGFANVPCSLQVYTDVKNTPEDGNLVYDENITVPGNGYFTIPLSRSIKINKDQKFSIVIKNRDDWQITYICTDRSYSPEGSKFISYNHTEAGQSYIFHYSENKWKDLNDERFYSYEDGTSLCIKALMNEPKEVVYTVVFDGQEASVPGTESIVVRPNQTLPQISVPVKNGFEFDGYYTEANGNGIKYYNSDGKSDKAFDLEGNLTLYANWIHVHDWIIRKAGNRIEAYCSNEGCPSETSENKIVSLELNGGTYELTGDAIAKNDLFSGIDFTPFNEAVGTNLSIADIKLYDSADTYGMDNLLEINKAGEYLAELTIEAVTINCSITIVDKASIPTEEQEGDKPEEQEGDKPAEQDRIVYPIGDEAAQMQIAAIANQVYTGKAIKPEVTVQHNGKILTAGKDYTVSYKNNIKANAFDSQGLRMTGGIGEDFNSKLPYVIITGKGNYSNVIKMNFNIVPADISATGNSIIPNISDCIVINPKAASTVTCKITFNGKALSGKNDYSAELTRLNDNGRTEGNVYPGMKVPKGEKGRYVLKVTGKGNFCGSFTREIILTDSLKSLFKSSVTLNKIAYEGIPLTADNIKAAIKSIKIGKEVVDTDKIRVELANNIEAPGTYDAVIVSNDTDTLAGSKNIKVTVTGIAISKATVKFPEKAYYDNSNHGTNGMVVTTGKGANIETLQPEKDFKAVVSNDTKAGTATIILTGIGKYTGTKKVTYKIYPYTMTNDDQAFSIEQISPQHYQKSGAMPDIKLRFLDKPLEKGIDYKLSYSNNKKVGTGKIIITGMGSFKGKITGQTFVIEPASFVDAGVTVSVADLVINTKKPAKFEAVPKLFDGNNKALVAGKDYKKSFRYYYYTGEEPVADCSSEVIEEHKGDEIPTGTVLEAGDRVVVEASAMDNGMYTGCIYGTYRVVEASIGSATFKVNSKTYTGELVTLEEKDFLTAQLKKNVLLEYGSDYEIVSDSYISNTKVGTAKVILRGIGKYGGTRTVSFKINKQSMAR